MARRTEGGSWSHTVRRRQVAKKLTSQACKPLFSKSFLGQESARVRLLPPGPDSVCIVGAHRDFGIAHRGVGKVLLLDDVA